MAPGHALMRGARRAVGRMRVDQPPTLYRSLLREVFPPPIQGSLGHFLLRKCLVYSYWKSDAREIDGRPPFISNLYFRPNLIADSVFRGLAEWRECPIPWPNLIAASGQTLGKVALTPAAFSFCQLVLVIARTLKPQQEGKELLKNTSRSYPDQDAQSSALSN